MSSERVIALRVAYDGTRYVGWQVQPVLPTVQGALQEALAVLEKRTVTIYGAGRTDAGVHAVGQVASFRTSSRIPTEGYLKGLNSHLPHDIAVQETREMPADFHARFSARGKHYRYAMWNHPVRHPLAARTAWHVRHPLDLEAMNRAGAFLVGEHDFEAFRSAECDREHAIRTLSRVEACREGDRVLLHVVGTAFLRHMVRILAGTLMAVGIGKRPPEWVAEVRDARDRRLAGVTAPPWGLCLLRVFYDAWPGPAQADPGDRGGAPESTRI